MKKRLRSIFLIAAVTAGGIILFQVYWVYNTWQRDMQNLSKAASRDLERSIDIYQLRQNDLPASLNYKAPYLTFFMRTVPNIDSVALDTPRVIRRFLSVFQTVAIDQNHLPVVRTLVANLLSQQTHKPLNIDSLTIIFKKELLKDNIELPLRLVLLKKQVQIPVGKIAATINYYKSPLVVEATLDSSRFLLGRNIIPALVSLGLIVLSAGSLFYMGIIIRRQMLLDNLKNDFINNITHELRTPIAILKSSNDALTHYGGAQDPGRLAKHLKINADVLDQLNDNVDRVLDVARYQHGVKLAVPAAINLQLLIEQVMGRFSLMDSDISLKYRLPHTEIVTDRHMVDTIVTNLLDNAIKYSDAPAQVEILVSPVSEGWQLQITDHGKGIADIYLPLIFDKFYRVTSGDIHDLKGFGLGLSYVKELVTILNGTLSVSSRPGIGTSFILNFPRL